MSNENLPAQNNNTGIAQQGENDAIAQFRVNMQNFLTRLNAKPQQESIGKTSDGRASTILISHVEMLLDEYFFGLWSTSNFKWSVITNEIVASIDLLLTHPVSGKDFQRVGAAAVQIMVDKVPDSIKDKPVEKNRWALDPSNKKPGALDMGFPKLKAECIKNAANSLGKLFGRDLNRQQQDTYQPLFKERNTYNPQNQ